MEIVYSIFIGIIVGMIARKIDSIVLQCRRGRKPPVLERCCSLETRALKLKTQLCAQLCEQEARKRTPHLREDPPRGVGLGN